MTDHNRRTFLKKASTVALGTTALAASTGTASAHFGFAVPVFTTVNLSVRSSPDLSASRYAVAEDHTGGIIVDGPVDNDGYRWWKIQYNGDDDNGLVTGWSVERYLEHASFGYPTGGYVTQTPQSGHWACDISAGAGDTDRGTDIFAARHGTVSYARNTGGACGKMIKIDHGYGYNTKYCHLDNIRVFEGQNVRFGEHIGDMGDTGSGQYVHLHFAIENPDYGPGTYGGMDWPVEEDDDVRPFAGVARDFPGIPGL